MQSLYLKKKIIFLLKIPHNGMTLVNINPHRHTHTHTHTHINRHTYTHPHTHIYIFIQANVQSKQLDIKLEQFTQEELNSVLRKIKNRKAAGLDEISPEVWKTKQFDDILLRHCNTVYNQNIIDRWAKGCILPFPKKGRPWISQELPRYNPIAAKIYNALLRNRKKPQIENIIRKNQNDFRRNRSTTLQILTIHRILENVRANNLEASILYVDFGQAFDSIHRGKMEQILLAYGNYTRIVRAILNKSWRQHPRKQQPYGYLPPITKTIQVRQTRHAGHCWRRSDELISDILQWTPSYGRAKAR